MITQSLGDPVNDLFVNQYYDDVGLSPACVIFMVVLTVINEMNLEFLWFIGSGPFQSHSLNEFISLKNNPSVNLIGEYNLESASGAVLKKFNIEFLLPKQK